MTKVIPMELEKGTIIYFESKSGDEEIVDDVIITASQPRETMRDIGIIPKGGTFDKAMEKVKGIQETIQDYTKYALKAFEDTALANVNKVTLEFGIKIGGKTGFIVAEGTAETNLKITVECNFPEK